MNKHGFTLIEMLCVIALLSIIAVVTVETNFFNLIGSRDQFENEEMYQYLNEAALMYERVEDNCKDEDFTANNCIITVEDLLNSGYIDNSFNLLRGSNSSGIKGDFTTECVPKEKCNIKITKDNDEKKACVLKYNNETATGKNSCD